MIKAVLAKLLEFTRYKNLKYAKRHGMIVGESCVFDTDVWFGSEPSLIEIGNKVRLTKGVKFITHDGSLWVVRNSREDMNKANKYAEIKIGNNVNIGWETIILPGVTIGDNVIIGAGSVVTKDIPSNSVAAGTPCRVISNLESYIEKNRASFIYHEADKVSKEKAIAAIK